MIKRPKLLFAVIQMANRKSIIDSQEFDEKQVYDLR
jgi:hypothetical protein